MRRRIINIDEEKCDGCGQCAEACTEGAIQIINGKARLVREYYCDGLGACIGECPRGAITIEEREALPFDPESLAHRRNNLHEQAVEASAPFNGGPGMKSLFIEPDDEQTDEQNKDQGEAIMSRLRNWPVQLALVPLRAPYFNNADITISADCVPFAFADFHRRFLSSRALLMGCPKFDDADFYIQKLSQIFLQNHVRSIELVYMEVPCCRGLVHIVKRAIEDSGCAIHIVYTKISIKGKICESRLDSGTVPDSRRSPVKRM